MKKQFSFATFLLVAVLIYLIAWLGFIYFDIGHDKVEAVPSLHGLSIETVFERLGPTKHTDSYKVKVIGDIFRRPLLKLIPCTKPEDLEK